MDVSLVGNQLVTHLLDNVTWHPGIDKQPVQAQNETDFIY